MYKLNDEKMFYDMADGQAVVINCATGIYYGTSLIGSEVLDRLLAGLAVNTIISALKALPGCPGDIESQIDEFIKKLLEIEIILPGETANITCEPIGESALGDGFCFNIDEFSDVQDLLLADPVHNVDVELGWPILKE